MICIISRRFIFKKIDDDFYGVATERSATVQVRVVIDLVERGGGQHVSLAEDDFHYIFKIILFL